MRAEEVIKRYDEIKKELRLLDFQLSNFKGISENDIIDTMTYSHAEGDKVKTSGTSDKTFNIAIKCKSIMERKNDEWYEFLWQRKISLTEEIDFFEQSIEIIEHSDIAKAMFIQKMTWTEIESLFSISHSSVGKYRKQIVKELEEIYDARDRQLESYLLS